MLIISPIKKKNKSLAKGQIKITDKYRVVSVKSRHIPPPPVFNALTHFTNSVADY